MTHRYLIVVALLAVLALGCGTSPKSPMDLTRRARQAQRTAGYQLYWLGRSFEGLPLTDVLHDHSSTSFIYGDCHATGESGCAPPLEIQVWSICERNVLLLDAGLPTRFRARALTVLDYGDDDLELATADAGVVVFARRALARRAISALRPFVGPRRRALPPPRYPRYYLAQLRRVRDAYARTANVRAVRDKLKISVSAVRLQLALADRLGATRLRHAGTAPDLQEVKRDLLAATLSDEGAQKLDPGATALSAQRGRTLRASCELESDAPRGASLSVNGG